MKLVFTGILTFFVLFSLGCMSTRQHRDHRDGPGYRNMPALFWENGEATVTVKEVGVGLGTGFVISKNGLILTNWHVVAPKMLKTTAPDGTVTIKKSSQRFEICQMKGLLEVCSPATLFKSDKVRDLAILKTNRRFPYAVSFMDDTNLQPLDPIYSWANVSVMLSASLFQGRYINRIVPLRNRAKIEYLVFDMSLNPGGSGSAIFDWWTGNCIGSARSVTTLRGASLAIAIPSHEIVAFFKQVGVKIVLTPSERSRLRRKGK